MNMKGLGIFLVGSSVGFAGCALIVVALILTGNLAVLGRFPQLAETLQWIWENLRLSIVFFPMVLAAYFLALERLNSALTNPNISVDRIQHLNTLVNIFISLFFGIGVIWTAIGMRAALIEALGNLDSTTAAKMGAWQILERLVKGGILMALSTTIVGGLGGYLMRLFKGYVIGPKLNAVMRREASVIDDKVIDLLEQIRDAVESKAAPTEISEKTGDTVR